MDTETAFVKIELNGEFDKKTLREFVTTNTDLKPDYVDILKHKQTSVSVLKFRSKETAEDCICRLQDREWRNSSPSKARKRSTASKKPCDSLLMAELLSDPESAAYKKKKDKQRQKYALYIQKNK